jgi:hypothetical protein
MPLSRFGRGMGASTYAISPFLYHAEFVGLPPVDTLQELQRKLAWLVDRNLQRGGGFTWVRGELLVGSPSMGGFGLIPLKQHILARHAWWAHRLLLHDEGGGIPWVQMARWWLATAWGPGWHVLLACWFLPHLHNTSALHSQWLPYPLLRIFEAWHVLMPGLRDVRKEEEPLQPGPWCASAPLYGNISIKDSQGDVLDPREFLVLLHMGVHDVSTAMQLRERVMHFVGGTREWEAAERARLGRPLADVVARGVVAELLQRVCAAIPPSWIQQCGGPASQVDYPSLGQVAAKLLGRLGWESPFHREWEGKVISVLGYTVKVGTELQLGEVRRDRWARWDAFVREARGLEGDGTVDYSWHKLILQALKEVWKLKWDNRRKEILWLATLNGLPTPQRYPAGEQQCPCGLRGAGCPGRKHQLWDCAVAQAVVQEITRVIGRVQVTCEQLWLQQPPRFPVADNQQQLVHQGVWRVVCVCALGAMWSTTRSLMFADKGNLGAIADLGARVDRACTLGVVKFWDLVLDFVKGARPPASWKEELGGDHPFVAFVDEQPAGGRGAFVVNRRLEAAAGVESGLDTDCSLGGHSLSC